MMRFICLCLILGLSGCLANPRQEDSRYPVPHASQFVESFLRMEYSDVVSNDVPFVIVAQLSVRGAFSHNQTLDECKEDLVRQAKQHDKKLVEAVMSLFQENSEERPLESLGDLTLKHVALTEEEFKGSGKDGWEQFHKSHPDSRRIITLSFPGFSRDGSTAVIYMSSHSGWLSARGRLYILRKKDGKWVDAEISIGRRWIS